MKVLADHSFIPPCDSEIVDRETNIRETNILFSYLLQQHKIKYYNKQKFL